MKDIVWRDGDFEEDAPDEGFTKRLYDHFDYLKKNIIRQKITIGLCLGVVGFGVFFMLTSSSASFIGMTISFSLTLIFTVRKLIKTVSAKKENEIIRDEDLIRYDDEGRFT